MQRKQKERNSKNNWVWSSEIKTEKDWENSVKLKHFFEKM
jgi:hypothetical protein